MVKGVEEEGLQAVPWQTLLQELVSRRKFWIDAVTLNTYFGAGVTSLVWEILSDDTMFASMFLPELVNVVAMGQTSLVAFLVWSNRDVLNTLLGRLMLFINVLGIGLHLKRIKAALASGGAYKNALESVGIKNMRDPMVPMLLALLFPFRNFLGSKANGLTRTPYQYGNLANRDPELHKWNSRLPNSLKIANMLVGRGRVAQWMTLDVVHHKDFENRVKLPVLVYIHGGGWVVGDRIFAAKSTIEYLVANFGIVACVINYRMAPEVKFPEQLYDCKRALVWARKQAPQLGGDPEKIFVSGDSAGGHLTSMMALTANNPSYDPPEFDGEDTSVRGVIDIYGVHDLLDEEEHHLRNEGRIEQGKAGVTRLLERIVFQKSLKTDSEAFQEASPSFLLNEFLNGTTQPREICPYMLVHGTIDTLAAFDDSKSFFQRLRELRKKTNNANFVDVFVEIEDTEHGFGYLPAPRSVALAHAMGAFIDFHCQEVKHKPRL